MELCIVQYVPKGHTFEVQSCYIQCSIDVGGYLVGYFSAFCFSPPPPHDCPIYLLRTIINMLPHHYTS